jgi:hypothetical protein
LVAAPIVRLMTAAPPRCIRPAGRIGNPSTGNWDKSSPTRNDSDGTFGKNVVRIGSWPRDAGGSRTHFDRVAAGGLAVWLQRRKYPRQESNLILDLRRVACASTTPRGRLQFGIRSSEFGVVNSEFRTPNSELAGCPGGFEPATSRFTASRASRLHHGHSASTRTRTRNAELEARHDVRFTIEAK